MHSYNTHKNIKPSCIIHIGWSNFTSFSKLLSCYMVSELQSLLLSYHIFSLRSFFFSKRFSCQSFKIYYSLMCFSLMKLLFLGKSFLFTQTKESPHAITSFLNMMSTLLSCFSFMKPIFLLEAFSLHSISVPSYFSLIVLQSFLSFFYETSFSLKS